MRCGWRASYLLFGILSLLTSPVLADDVTNPVIRMATTTSTENSGLLGYLLPKFEQLTGYKVHVIAVGTGKALRMGRDGDVDVLLVHAPPAEKKFVAEGYGEKRYPVMYNDFVIVGPKTDPAHLSTAGSIKEAFQRLIDTRHPFVSRGDDSGTHKKERSIWSSLGLTPSGKWYREAGQGMGKVLQMSGELDAYTLTDRGTWLAFQEKSPLKICFQGDEKLFNPYAIIAVNPKKYPDTNYVGATALIRWITDPTGQKLIGAYRVKGNQLFTPSARTVAAKSDP